MFSRVSMFIKSLVMLVRMMSNGKIFKILECLKYVNAIESKSNGDIYIEFKSSVFINTIGNQVRYSKNGAIITAGSWTSENPDIEVGLYKDDINSLVLADYSRNIDYMIKNAIGGDKVNNKLGQMFRTTKHNVPNTNIVHECCHDDKGDMDGNECW